MASAWVKIRNGIKGAAMSLVFGNKVVAGGQLANDITTVVKSAVAVSDKNESEDAIYELAISMYNAKNTVKLPTEVIPCVKSLIKLAKLEAEYLAAGNTEKAAEIKVLISNQKREMVSNYLDLGIKLGKVLLDYLIQKYILKGKIL